MVNKKESIRLIWSEAIVSAWPRSVRVHDWSDHGRVHVGDTKNRNKTCVHQISKISPMKWVRVWLRVVTSVWGCVVVNQRCRGSNGKVKIEGHMSISDEEAHHQAQSMQWTESLFQSSQIWLLISMKTLSPLHTLCSDLKVRLKFYIAAKHK